MSVLHGLVQLIHVHQLKRSCGEVCLPSVNIALPPQHDPEITPTLLLHTLFLLEREGGGEYSEARLSQIGTVVWKFMSKSIATLGT